MVLNFDEDICSFEEFKQLLIEKGQAEGYRKGFNDGYFIGRIEDPEKRLQKLKEAAIEHG